MKNNNINSVFKMSHDYIEIRELYCKKCNTKVGEEDTDDDVSWNVNLKYDKCPTCMTELRYKH